MSLSEVTLRGTLNADGTVQLDESPALPPGRVVVVWRPDAGPLPADDPFWRRMQAIWDAQQAAGVVPRSVEEIEAERGHLRQE